MALRCSLEAIILVRIQAGQPVERLKLNVGGATMARGKGRATVKLNQRNAGWRRDRTNTAARNVVGQFKSGR